MAQRITQPSALATWRRHLVTAPSYLTVTDQRYNQCNPDPVTRCHVTRVLSPPPPIFIDQSVLAAVVSALLPSISTRKGSAAILSVAQWMPAQSTRLPSSREMLK
ncbi:hypothetical protein MATL_G00085150 [Megalops atlanticus]|uniref:Uncharacterized protein n=1 Tax=Megalops atlanticus TaxID=7932 RepID=A0A9D3Q815_MEGAT|nr:hypothetical protein MATL_G00085150 [Megalops atlanticus]